MSARIGSRIGFASALFALSAACAGGGGGSGSGGKHEPDWTFPAGIDSGVRVEVSADGSEILAGGGVFVHLLSTAAEAPLWSWESLAEYEHITSVALARDGSRGAASGEGIYAFDTAGPVWANEFIDLPGGGYTDAIGPVAINESGTAVIGAGVYLTRYAGATGAIQWVAEPYSANLVAISRDGETIAADLAGPGVALFGAGSGTPLWVSPDYDMLDDILVALDGSYIVVSGNMGVTCYARESGTSQWSWTPPNGMDVQTITMPEAADSVIAGGAGFVAHISIATGKADWIYEASLGGVFSVAVTADGERIAVGSDWGVVTSLNGRGKVRWIHEEGSGRILSVSLSDDGSVLAAGTWDGVLVFLE